MIAAAELPLVLAGPIVRRAEPGRLCIWLASSRQLTLKASIHELNGPNPRAPAISTQLPAESEATVLRLGERLWVQLISVTPSGDAGEAFPAGRLLAYDLFEPEGERRRLRDLLRIEDIAVAPLPLPTVVLQSEQLPLHMLYASCRKLHGVGDDGVFAAEAMLRGNAIDHRLRPNAMLLSGDQIYADDVADLLAKEVSDLAVRLMGRREEVPGLRRSPYGIPVRGRGGLVRGAAGFTSEKADNHLLTFGEFAAMYLLAWSPECWPTRLPDGVEAWGSMSPPNRPPVWKWSSQWRKQKESLVVARRGSAAMRRVLANVPTYMVFDDHEVTDDWNLNPRWTRRVLTSPAGARIVLNGMAAYWAFQAWGNAPDDFSEDFRARVQRYCETGRGDRQARELLTGFAHWAYRAPTHPPMAVLNTRTRRGAIRTVSDEVDGLPSPRSPFAPRLLGRAERTEAAALMSGRQGKSLIVVSPTPVFGVEAVERLQELQGSRDPAGADLESWHANPINVADAVRLLSGASPSPAIVLSGDVHYGFNATARIDGSHRIPVLQLTSSAMKNEVDGVKGGLLSALGVLGGWLPMREYWWWPPGDGDGETRVVHSALPLSDILFKDHDARKELAFEPVVSSGGNPLHQKLMLPSNVGELWVEGRNVRHRFWTQVRGRAQAMPVREWRPGTWPF